VSDPLADALADVLRPVVAELVAKEFDRRAAEFEPPSEPAPYDAVAEYARKHRTTPVRSVRDAVAALFPARSSRPVAASG
jgi:hypothetical protein